MRTIEEPVFIIGSGRSGTTLLYGLLAMHPDVCWFSNLTAKFPHSSWLSVLHRMTDLPMFSDRMKDQFWRRTQPSLRPSEAGSIYHQYCGLEEARRMTEADLTPEIERRLKKTVSSHQFFTGKKRFLGKQTTNNQHIRLIHTVFPDAYFVHIIRDGRAVASSLYAVSWWPETKIWWLGLKPYEWEAIGEEPIALCALQWWHDVDEIRQNRSLFAERYLEIRYEDLVADPTGTIDDILRFCGIREVVEFRQRLPQNLKNMNYKWRAQLCDKQIQVLKQTIGESLALLGYAA